MLSCLLLLHTSHGGHKAKLDFSSTCYIAYIALSAVLMDCDRTNGSLYFLQTLKSKTLVLDQKSGLRPN